MKTTTLISSALAAVIAIGAITAHAADEKDKGTEKCYGIAKAGKNDCASSGHSCAGQSKGEANGKEWVKLPTGTCDRIVGGSTSPK